MYSYPKYGTFDPTTIMSIFYFLIFGLMFADVGYGVLVTLIGFLAPKILRMKPSMTRMLNMFAYCGIACAICGFIFGGWFGDLPYALMTSFGGYESTEAAKEAFPIFNGLVITLGGSPVSLNPLDNPMAFLVISLAMGAVHLIAGMAVKFVLLCKQGHRPLRGWPCRRAILQFAEQLLHILHQMSKLQRFELGIPKQLSHLLRWLRSGCCP